MILMEMEGYTTVTGGTIDIVVTHSRNGITITPNQDASTISVVYGRGGGTAGVVVGTKIGLTKFSIWVRTQVQMRQISSL